MYHATLKSSLLNFQCVACMEKSSFFRLLHYLKNLSTFCLKETTCSEVAALLVGDFDDQLGLRDIVVETKSRNLARISELHPAYLPLQYPILFPYGEDGYHIDLQLKKTTTSKNPRIRVSMKEFFAYRIMERCNQFNVILFSGKLFQQFLVDAYTMMESERIGYLKLNQKTLRADKYSNISTFASTGNKDSSMCGKRIVLPSSFVGSPRYMHEKYMDAMAVCSHFGYPDLFITFTCNPKWPEITRYLTMRHSQPEDRPFIEEGTRSSHRQILLLSNSATLYFSVSDLGWVPVNKLS